MKDSYQLQTYDIRLVDSWIVGLPDEDFQVNKFAKALLLALVFAAPVTVFASQAQAKTIHHASVKSAKHHYKTHYKHNAKNLTHKTHK